MGPSNIRDLLTSFSPSLDFFAVSSGDGRIKIWDTVKGQLQTEFTDVTSTDETDFFLKSESGHLSLDYKCMKWVSLERKRKRKVESSLLVLGTGSGDVLALDVSAGQLKWRISDCHPGGVTAISFSTCTSCIYTTGVDGMVCQIGCTVGNQLGRFRASTKAISSMAISYDGNLLATAAAQLKIFSCSDNKKIQKFSGHPSGVRYMTFTEDGKYLVSSAVGERNVAVWKINGAKNQAACCVLSMEHPAVFLHSKCVKKAGNDDHVLYVLAISEIGVCYFWYGKDIQELRTKPTKISLSSEAHLSRRQKGSLPSIYAAELKGIVKPGSVDIFLACGSLVKPSFEKLLVHHGEDVKLNSSLDGVLLPIHQEMQSQKGKVMKTEVTALDRTNAEDAFLPIPKIHDLHGRESNLQQSVPDHEELMVGDIKHRKVQAKTMDLKDDSMKIEEESMTISIEERLKSLGILSNEDNVGGGKYSWIANDLPLTSATFSDARFEANMNHKIKATVSSMAPRDAYRLLSVLVETWTSRSGSGKHIVPWICSIVVHHSSYIKSQEPSNQMLDSLYKIINSKCSAVQPLLQLSGRMQLIRAQIDKGKEKDRQTSPPNYLLDDGEEEDEDVYELVYGEEDELQSDSSDD